METGTRSGTRRTGQRTGQRTARRTSLLGAAALTLGLAGGLAATGGTSYAATGGAGSGHPRLDHDTDDVHGSAHGRMAARARTISVNPATGPDFELPFTCGQVWNGSSRSSHSPSYWTVDFNRVPDRGQPALASAAGVVTKVVTLTGSYGRYVVIDHGGGWSTLYAHLDGFTTTVGTRVDQGDQIGIVGGSGGVTGPHLHFEERKDGAYFNPYFHRTSFRMGSDIASQNCNDRPVSGDWDGDGRTELGIARDTSTNVVFNQRRANGSVTATRWGQTPGLPLTGDFDGDRTAQVGVRRHQAAVWYLRSRTGAVATVSNAVGAASDQPLTGDWDGNGRDNLGFYRPSTATFYQRADNYVLTAVRWGSTGDLPVTGDWNGDGRTDIGSFDPDTGVWSLRVPSGSGWTTRTIQYGKPGDLPVTGDWDGDGTTEVGVWRPSIAVFGERSARGVTTSVVYGVPRG